MSGFEVLVFLSMNIKSHSTKIKHFILLLSAKMIATVAYKHIQHMRWSSEEGNELNTSIGGNLE